MTKGQLQFSPYFAQIVILRLQHKLPETFSIVQHAGAVSFGSAAFGAGTGLILLDNVQCAGTETTLLSCPSSGIGIHDCSHAEDAGVRCLGKSKLYTHTCFFQS